MDDLLHALLFVWPDIPELDKKFNQYSKRFEVEDASAFKEITEIVRKLYDIIVKHLTFDTFENMFDFIVAHTIGKIIINHKYKTLGAQL